MKRPEVVHYQRKRRPNANYSLEAIFEDVRIRIASKCDVCVRIAPHYSNGLLARMSIIADVHKVKSSLIHVTGDINFAILGAKKHSGILTIPDCGFLSRASGLKRWILRKFWLELPVRFAKVTTTISETSADEIVRLCKCKREKIRVIPVGISTSFLKRPKNFNTEQPTILHVGTAFNKNLARLIEAIKNVKCKLVVIGEIPKPLKTRATELGICLENKIGLSKAEVVEAYIACDLLCFASTYEGFGMPILEAQATGRPVITSNVSSMPEVAGAAACFVNPHDVSSIRDGIRRVIYERNYRESLVEMGYANTKRFDPQIIAEQYLQLYQSLN